MFNMFKGIFKTVKTLILLVGLVAIGHLAFLAWRYKSQVTMVQRVLLESAKSQNFLVLGSRVVNIELKPQTQTQDFLDMLDDLLFKKATSIEAKVRVYYGINLDKDSFKKAVKYDIQNNCVQVFADKLGRLEILDAVVLYPIEFNTQKGLLRIFEDSTQEDINSFMPYVKKLAIEQVQESLASAQFKEQVVQDLTNLLTQMLQNKVRICAQ